MKLLSLALLNFKGVKLFQLETSGENVSIYGDNGTGKTTVCDAMYYLLFDKDSQFKKQFEIKTLTPKGIAIPGLNHEVEGVFLTDSGKTLTLKKSYKEIWSNKRGQAQKTFTGHTTDYYIDEIPVKKKEFTERASEYFIEETFKLLTTPTYFSETLPWRDRRELLLKISGNISDEDVINSDSELKDLNVILADRSIEDHKKVIAGKKSKLNDEIKQIPVRIDEATRSIPGLDFIDLKEENIQLEKTKKQISEKEKQISRIESGSEISEQKKKLSEIETVVINLKNNQTVEHQKTINIQRKKYDDAESAYNLANGDVSNITSEINNLDLNKSYYVDEINRLRDLWHKKENMQFVLPENPENCPACGQSIPEEDRKKVEEKAREEFNLYKANEIEKVNYDGTEAAKKVDELDEVLKEKNKMLEHLNGLKESKKQAMDIAHNSLNAIKNTPPVDTGDILKNNSDIEEIKSTIEKLKSGTEDQINEIKDEIEKLIAVREVIEKNISSYESSLKIKERIAELENQERILAGEIEGLENELFLIEKFVKIKVELLESNINSKFKLARFKLFKTQINGGLDECCDVTFEGVPFGSGLNNGARINIGLDIIQTLSEHFNTTAPIFIDNAESVTEINIPENSQVIKMIVSEADKVLRVEL